MTLAKHLSLLAAVIALPLTGCVSTGGRADLRLLRDLAASDPKPFVIVESTVKGTTSRGQGVLVTPQGHVVSAGHVSWDNKAEAHAASFRIKVRTRSGGVPAGFEHHHKTKFVDREDAVFHEHRYVAKWLRREDSRFVDGKDLCVLKVDAKDALPCLPFFSEDEPELAVGEVLHLCHYHWPHSDAEPTFLINPIEIVGVAETTSGPQYLARGFCRWGSSGGAILKNGRLVGIQSAAYTINAKDIGEVPAGLLSFEVVYRELFDGLLDAD